MKMSFMSIFYIHQLYIKKKLGADTGCPNWAPEQHSKSLPSHPAWL